MAVKMMLTRSSWSIALRSSISAHERLRLGVDLGLRVLVARGRAPQRQQSHGSGGYSEPRVASDRSSDRGGVQRPHLVGAQRPPLARRELRGR